MRWGMGRLGRWWLATEKEDEKGKVRPETRLRTKLNEGNTITYRTCMSIPSSHLENTLWQQNRHQQLEREGFWCHVSSWDGKLTLSLLSPLFDGRELFSFASLSSSFLPHLLSYIILTCELILFGETCKERVAANVKCGASGSERSCQEGKAWNSHRTTIVFTSVRKNTCLVLISCTISWSSQQQDSREQEKTKCKRFPAIRHRCRAKELRSDEGSWCTQRWMDWMTSRIRSYPLP